MPKYTCPKCSEVFDDLFDLSGCLAKHNEEEEISVVEHSAVAYPTRTYSHTPNRYKIDLASLPEGYPSKADLPILKQFATHIISEFFVDMPWDIPLLWSRRGKSTLGRIVWGTSSFSDHCEKVVVEDGARERRREREGTFTIARWSKTAYIEIHLQFGQDWLKTLCTLTHELLHAYDYYKHGFWSKSWTQAHLGYFDTRKNSINRELKAMGSEINISVKGGDRQMDGETETWLRANLQKGSHIYWEWQTDAGKVVKGLGIVKRRSSHMITIDAYNVEPKGYRHVNKVPWQKVKQIDGFDVIDWMEGTIP